MVKVNSSKRHLTSLYVADGSVLLSSPALQHRAHRSRFALNPRYAMLCFPFYWLLLTTLFIRSHPTSLPPSLPFFIPYFLPYLPTSRSTSFPTFLPSQQICLISLFFLTPFLLYFLLDYLPPYSHHSLPPSFSLTYALLYFLLISVSQPRDSQ
jgi:hypothetical protein